MNAMTKYFEISLCSRAEDFSISIINRYKYVYHVYQYMLSMYISFMFHSVSIYLTESETSFLLQTNVHSSNFQIFARAKKDIPTTKIWFSSRIKTIIHSLGRFKNEVVLYSYVPNKRLCQSGNKLSSLQFEWIVVSVSTDHKAIEILLAPYYKLI